MCKITNVYTRNGKYWAVGTTPNGGITMFYVDEEFYNKYHKRK